MATELTDENVEIDEESLSKDISDIENAVNKIPIRDSGKTHSYVNKA